MNNDLTIEQSHFIIIHAIFFSRKNHMCVEQLQVMRTFQHQDFW